MNVTHKTLGLSVFALAAGLFATATIADNMPQRGGMMDEAGLIQADADKDGKITQAEFDAWRAGRLAAMDTDKDGKVSAEEMLAARQAAAAERAKLMAERMIARHDTDKDGFLSAAELEALPSPGFAKLDANGDGSVDQAELEAFRADHGPRGGRHGKRGHHGQHEVAPDAN